VSDKIHHLLSLLDKAAAEMLSYGNEHTFSYFDTCKDVGLFIQDVITKARNGELSEISKLWYIFAPTSVWDDSGGSPEIANEIFEIINKKYKPE
jgi:hypothetical protein